MDSFNLLKTMAPTFKTMELLVRVAAVAELLNPVLEAYDKAELSIGLQTFQDELIEILLACLLCEVKWIDCAKVGVHPANREGSGLIAGDVHDLLLRIFFQGWSWAKCASALVCELPPGVVGESWRDFNTELSNSSGGLIPTPNKEEMFYFTGRGSHTTAAVRCMMYSATGIHDDLCDDGSISKAKIVHKQPSMQEPLDKGMRYSVLKHEICNACPLLMPTLSRLGNADHDVARKQTSFQACRRLFDLHWALKASRPSLDNTALKNEVLRIGCQGMDPDYKESAEDHNI